MIATRRHALSLFAVTLAFPIFSNTTRSAYASEMTDVPIVVVSHTEEESETPSPYTQLSTSFSFAESKSLTRISVNKGSLSVSVNATCPIDGVFSVSLYKGSTSFGTASFKRNGYTKATWNNLTTGSYTIRFTKAKDGSTVKCTRVTVS